MALEIIGTAYVRIRAVTTSIASDLKKGFDDGVKEAGLDKTGGGAADEFSGGFGKEAEKTLGKELKEGFEKGLKDVDFEKGGGESAKSYGDGVDKETKKRNPFRSILDAFKNIGKGLSPDDLHLPDLNEQGKTAGDSYKSGFFSSVKSGLGKVFSGIFSGLGKKSGAGKEGEAAGDDFRLGLFGKLKSGVGHIFTGLFSHLGFGKHGEESGEKFVKGAARGTKKKKNPFASLFDSVSKIILSFAKSPISWVGLLAPTTLGPVVVAIGAMLASVTAGLGFIVLAAAGAGVALGGLAAVALPGLGVLFAAFKTQTKQLDAFKESAKKLLEPWKAVGVATQKNLLPGMTKFLKSIQHLVPLVSNFGGKMGKLTGGFVAMAGKALISKKNMEALGKILDNSVKFFDNIYNAAIAFIHTVLPLFAAMTPLAVQLSGGIEKVAIHFANFVDAGTKSGSLAATFQSWYDKFVVISDIVGNVLGFLWGILSVAGETSTPFFDKVQKVTQGWSDWVKKPENKNKIAEFFENAKPFVHEVWELISNIAELFLGPLLKGPEGDMGAATFGQLTDALHKLNDVLEKPEVKRLAPWILGVTVALKGLSVVGALNPALGILKTVLGGLAKIAWAVLVWGVEALAGALATLGTALIPLLPYIIAIAAAIAIFWAVWHFWPQIEGFIKRAWEWFTNLNTPLKILVGTFAVLALAVSPALAAIALIVGIVAAIKHWDEIVKMLEKVWDAIWNFFTRLPGIFARLPGQLATLGGKILLWLQELPGKIKEALLDELRKLPDQILDALGALGRLGQDLIGKIAEGLGVALPWLAQWFTELPIKILGWLGGLLGEMLKFGGKILDWLIQGLVEWLPKVLTWFLQLPWEILTLLRKALTELIKLGWEMLMALKDGLIDAWPRIVQWFKDLPGNLLSGIKDVGSWLLQVGSDIIQGIWQGLQNNWDKVLTFFKELPGKILEFLKDAGTWLKDTGEKLLKGLIEGAGNVWDSIKEFFGTLPGQILDFIKDAAPVVWDWFKGLPGTLWNLLKEGASDLWQWFKDLPGNFFRLLGEGASNLWDFFKGMPAEFFRLLGEGASNLWDFFKGMPAEFFRLLGEGASNLWDFFKGMPAEFFRLLGEGAGNLWDFFKGMPAEFFRLLGEGASNLWDFFKDLPGEFFDLLDGGGSNLWDFFKGMPGKFFHLLVEGAGNLWDFFTGLPGEFFNLLTDGANKLWNFFKGMPGKIVGFITRAFSIAGDIGREIIQWIWDKVDKAAHILWEFFTGLPGKIFDFIVEALTTVGDIGTRIVGWIWQKIQDGIQVLWDFFKDLPSTIFNTIVDALTTAGDIGREVIQWIWDKVDKAAHIVWEFFSGLPGEIFTTVKKALETAHDIGAEVIQWIWDKIDAAAHIVWEFFTGLPGKIFTAIKDALALAADIGWEIIHWLLVTIGNAEDGIWNFFKKMPDKAWEFLKKALETAVNVGEKIVGWIVAGLQGGEGIVAKAILALIPDFVERFIPGIDALKNAAKAKASGSILLKLVPTLDQNAIPALAAGAIVTRPILAAIGEAGSEVVIPLTQPRRALQLAQASGLDELILADLKRHMTTPTPAGPVTVLRIDNATFNDKVDVDLIAARILLAYKVAS